MDSLPFEEWVKLLGPKIKVEGNQQNRSVKSVSIDTRTLQPGDIYFAIKGDRYDGHDFVSAAWAAKTMACVVRNDWKSNTRIPEEQVIIRCDEPLETMQILAKNYRKKFSIPVLGLTGTNGKTTTKEMIANILETKFRVTKTVGNLNNHIGLPLSLLQIDNETDIAVIEMGMNHSGEIAQLCEIADPNYGMITNIGAGHLGFFTDVDEIGKAKGELFQALPDDGTAFVNADDPRVMREAQSLKNKVTYGFSPGVDIHGEDLGLDHNGCGKYRLQDLVDIQLQVPGKHQQNNALAASAVAMHFEIPIDEIADSLSGFTSFSKRMQLIEFGSNLIIMDAYNSNPDSLKSAFESLSYLAKKRKGRPLAALGDMLELGDFSQIEHNKAGKLAVDFGIEELFLYWKESQHTLSGYKQNGGNIAFYFEDKKELAQAVWESLREYDVLLIKGSRGMKMEDVWQELEMLAKSECLD